VSIGGVTPRTAQQFTGEMARDLLCLPAIPFPGNAIMITNTIRLTVISDSDDYAQFHFQWDNIIYGTNGPLPNVPPLTTRGSGQAKFNSNGKVSSLEFTFENYDQFAGYLYLGEFKAEGPEIFFDPTANCGTQSEPSVLAEACYGEYTDCVEDFEKETAPYGILRFAGNNLGCKQSFAILVPFNPELICPEVVSTTTAFCKDSVLVSEFGNFIESVVLPPLPNPATLSFAPTKR